MYKNNLVVVVKHNGKVLRETGTCVSLPFSSEYSLLVKNLNSRKVSVNISIDGEDVIDGKSLLIQSDSSTELKGFLSGKTAKNKFRFIEKTKQISKYRGDRADDGLIRVNFAFEKEQPTVTYHYHDVSDYWPPSKRRCPCEPFGPVKYCSGSNSIQKHNIKSGGFNSSNDILSCSVSNELYTNNSFNDDGITVKGSEINQDFNYGYIGDLEKSNVIVIRLRGEKNNGTVIERPVMVRNRLTCPTCGKRSRSDSKFCNRCGTFLE